MSDPKQEEYKVSWKGWLSLILLIVAFSGVFTKSTGPCVNCDAAEPRFRFG